LRQLGFWQLWPGAFCGTQKACKAWVYALRGSRHPDCWLIGKGQPPGTTRMLRSRGVERVRIQVTN
jgi:hypothetical protein